MKIFGKSIPLWAVATVMVLLVIGISAVFVRGTAAANEFFTEPVQRGALRNVVNATGTVQAVLTVQVGSQVSGQVQALYADYNSVVKHGQLLAKLDPRNYEAQVEQAKANQASAVAHVATAQADLKNQMASLLSAKANLQAAKVMRDNSAVVNERYQRLLAEKIVSQNDYDTSKANADQNAAKYAQAEAQVEQGEAQINSSQASIEQAKAEVAQTKAALDQAQVNLEYCTIYSPVDGVVVSRNIDVGQTVAASLQTPTLYLIAANLTAMQVNASVDEADIGNVAYAEDVQFGVDAFRNDVFHGTIAEIRLNPQTVQNVVTYSVIINVDNSELKLKPGMTANIRMTVAQRENVIRVPNASLRYLPPGVTQEQVSQMLKQGPDRTTPSSPAPPESTAAAGSGSASSSHTQPGGGIATGLEPGTITLAPGQLWNPADKILFPKISRHNNRPAVVWVLGADKKPQARQVVLGITDGAATELLSGDLHDGDKIIVADTTQTASGGQRGGGGMFRTGGR